MLAPGIHLLHKPVGPTSFAMMAACRASHPPKSDERPSRICHGGVLDPFASGLLLILVEPATKLFDYLHDVPKVYEATVRWGVETDTGDLHGQAVAASADCQLTQHDLNRALQSFVGWHDQIPPATSNKRVEGERAYVRAHRGETVQLPASRVYLHEATWLSHNLPETSRLRLVVRGGFYVRSLVRDLGRMLHCGAHLQSLHRTAIGPWVDPPPDTPVSLSGRDTLPWLARRELTDSEVGELRDNRPIPVGQLLSPDWSLPKGFPSPSPVVRGFHGNRFRFLLKPTASTFTLLTALRGGL